MAAGCRSSRPCGSNATAHEGPRRRPSLASALGPAACGRAGLGTGGCRPGIMAGAAGASAGLRRPAAVAGNGPGEHDTLSAARACDRRGPLWHACLGAPAVTRRRHACHTAPRLCHRLRTADHAERVAGSASCWRSDSAPMDDRSGPARPQPRHGSGPQGSSVPPRHDLGPAGARRFGGCACRTVARGAQPWSWPGFGLASRRTAAASAAVGLASGGGARLWLHGRRHGPGAGADPAANACRPRLARSQRCSCGGQRPGVCRRHAADARRDRSLRAGRRRHSADCTADCWPGVQLVRPGLQPPGASPPLCPLHSRSPMWPSLRCWP